MSASLADIAVSMAKALRLRATYAGDMYFNDQEHGPQLLADGRNILDPYWQVRCRDWLVERGHTVHFSNLGPHYYLIGPVAMTVDCPASEFCARAIHQLVSDGKVP